MTVWTCYSYHSGTVDFAMVVAPPSHLKYGSGMSECAPTDASLTSDSSVGDQSYHECSNSETSLMFRLKLSTSKCCRRRLGTAYYQGA